MQNLTRKYQCSNQKKFVRHVITNHIPHAIDRYITKAAEKEICTITEMNNKEEIKSVYAKRMIIFLEDILEGNPLKELTSMMRKWKRYELKCCHKLQPVLPEEILNNYSLLIKTVLSFLPEYNIDFATEHHIVSYFEDLEQQMEQLIFNTFKEIQKKAYQI